MTSATPPCVLTIAGSDPTGGAGLQLDLQVFARHEVHGMAVPTALTVQSTERVHRVLPAFPSVVGEQLLALFLDAPPDVVKIGMLATDDVLLRTADILERFERPRIVDPVLRASDGAWLLERRAWKNLLERIVAGAELVTPNLDEAEWLTGERDPERAAQILLEIGARAVLIKGGHADAPDDYLCSAERAIWIPAEERAADGAHGTGCALSAAIAARVALGEDVFTAAPKAKRFVERALAAAFRPGRGQRILRLGAP
jgi:hydroxymethylpyrimidine/phosphomethylpyrimidine kinase